MAFMRRHPFAALVSVLPQGQAEGAGLYASHLPFAVQAAGGKVTLLAHLAKNNPQAAALDGQEAMVIFTEPHAYISPSLYDKPLNVPTWNYVAVHAYGRVRLLHDEQGALDLLERQMQAFEAEYLSQWAGLPEDFKQAMLKGVVCFEMETERIEGKFKLSQNRNEHERQRVTAHLLESEDGAARTIGEMMEALKNH